MKPVNQIWQVGQRFTASLFYFHSSTLNSSEEKKWNVFEAGLPDGIVSYQKIPVSEYFKDLGMENFGIFQGHLVYFAYFWYIYDTAIGYILCLWWIFPILVCCAKENLAIPLWRISSKDPIRRLVNLSIPTLYVNEPESFTKCT
jgi:hypothetical protein